MCVAKNKKDVKMNTIQNYGITNYQPNFSAILKMPDKAAFEKFAGKYYYHIVKANSVSEIQRDKLIKVNKEIVNDSADLVSDVKLKMLRGRL
jgi:hypothetical protein